MEKREVYIRTSDSGRYYEDFVALDDVQVVFQSEKARHIEFTGNLRRYDDFGQIVSMLALACPAKFNVSGTTIYIAE